MDISTLRTGAQLLMVSTQEKVDYISPSTVSGKASVIRADGTIQDIDLTDLQLVALP